MQCIIFIGAQATGKSTMFRSHFARTHVHISLDVLRTRHREQRFFEICLETRQPFVVDNTNPRRTDRSRYIIPAREHSFTVIGYYFQSRIEDMLERNAARATGERIPDKGLRGTLAALELPSLTEGFDQLYYVEWDKQKDYRISGWNDEV
ncbi:MAG: ATP-binding protein [Candidatus Hydrogenedentes bacterium]|nr:ATP-binding protein [Candidatus Hydrogenedentota bacterium]